MVGMLPIMARRAECDLFMDHGCPRQMLEKVSNTSLLVGTMDREGKRNSESFFILRLWNNLPLHTRKLDSVTCLKKNMFARIFKEQLTLKHFVV